MADDKATRKVRDRYNRAAASYDSAEGLLESAIFNKWRKLLWSKVSPGRILEIGVGTGNNLPFYPEGAEMTAIDLSENMLGRAIEKARVAGVKVDFRHMDAQTLEFPDSSFDTVIATLVFCSVPDPVLGLREAKRVCRAGGKVLLLEHVLSQNPVLAFWMNLLNPIPAYFGGENFNRRTEENVVKSGLIVEKVTKGYAGIVKLIEARNK